MALPALSLASPLSQPPDWAHVSVKHAWPSDAPPRGWVVHSPSAPPDHVLQLSIGLKQDRFDQLVDELYAVSDPVHER